MGRRTLLISLLTTFYVDLAVAIAPQAPAPTPPPILRKRAEPAPPGPPGAAAPPPGVCGGCWVKAEAVGQVWDSAIHYYTVATESLAVDPNKGVTSLINSWYVQNTDSARATLTNSLIDSAMHKQYNYEPMLGTSAVMHEHTLVYPTSYLYIQYLTKFWNASTVINGQPTCISTSSKTALSPQLLHTIEPERDQDWLVAINKKDAENAPDVQLNIIPQDAYNTVAGFEQCTYGTAVGKMTTKGPVLTMTATTISYMNGVEPNMVGMGGGDHMHMNPTDTALGITGAAPGAGLSQGASPPTATARPGVTLASAGQSMDMPMPSGEKMELCDLLTVGAAVFTGTKGTFAIGEKLLTPAGPAITLFGTVVSEPAPTGGFNATPSVAIVAGSAQLFLKTMMNAAELNRTAPRLGSGGSAGAAVKASSGMPAWREGGGQFAASVVLSALGVLYWL